MLALMLSLWACTGEPGTLDDTGEPDTTDASSEGTIPAVTVQGQVTWTLRFDADAEALGYEDCAYTRSFEGTQYLDMDYLCPDCTVQVSGTATMTEGLDCYSQISSAPESERTEAWGWGDGGFHRSGRTQFPLGELSTFDDTGEGTEIALAWESESELTDGGVMILSAAGSLTYQTDSSILLPDPIPTRTEPYTCGWPQNDPGDLALDYVLGVGKTFPNVYLKDQCGELLSLWDLHGSWLVMDTSQSDCGPCQTMAASAEEFVADMAAEGIDVKVVSFLGNGLSEPFGTPSAATLGTWVDSFGLTDPVLYDRGFAYATFPDFVTEYTGESFGYPTWLVVSPEMELVHGNVGFGSWDDVAEIIRAGD